MSYYTYVATQCAAVTTHRLLSRAPPHDNFFDKNPDLMIAAYINTHIVLLRSIQIIAVIIDLLHNIMNLYFIYLPRMCTKV